MANAFMFLLRQQLRHRAVDAELFRYACGSSFVIAGQHRHPLHALLAHQLDSLARRLSGRSEQRDGTYDDTVRRDEHQGMALFLHPLQLR